MTSPTPYTPGPFDSTHIYVQWGGKLPGDEEWSCGFRMWSSGGSTPAQATDMLNPIAEAITDFHTRPETGIHQFAKLSSIKVNAIGTNGRYQAQSTTEAVRPDVAGGLTSSYVAPNQIALAVSLTTGYSRGPAHRGRFYLPMPGYGIGADGRINPGLAAQTRDSCNALLAEVNTALAGHQMVVMSRKLGASGHRAVTGTEVGTVLDTQRRRRRSLVENYQ